MIIFYFYLQYYSFPANPKGLSYYQAMRFQTGSSMVKLTTKCQNSLPDVEYPFIVFHDPDDRVVQFQGKFSLYISLCVFFVHCRVPICFLLLF